MRNMVMRFQVVMFYFGDVLARCAKAGRDTKKLEKLNLEPCSAISVQTMNIGLHTVWQPLRVSDHERLLDNNMSRGRYTIYVILRLVRLRRFAQNRRASKGFRRMT